MSCRQSEKQRKFN